MKIGKKIYLTLMVLFSAVCVFSACTKDPYKNMQLSVSTTSVTKEYSPDSADNFFDLSATVEGVDADDVSTAVQFTIANTDIIDIASTPSINGATTTQKFAIKSTGRTSILVTTVESGNDGAKRQMVDVNITSAIESLAFTYDTLPLVRGIRTDLTTNVYDGSGYLTYTPTYTTERNVELTAIDNAGSEITEGVVIDGNTITVTDDTLTEFNIRATSADNDQVVATTRAVVLEPISADDFTIKQVTDAGTSDLGTFILQGKDAYDIMLANADSVHETQNIKTVDVYAGDTSASGEGSAYTVRARGLNASGTAISGLNYLSARRNTNGTYTLGEGRGFGSDNIEFRVFYRGYENIFAPVTITLRVTVSSYPTLLQITGSATSTTALENIVVYKDTDYVAQVGTPVFVRIANDNGNLINQKAYVYVVDGDGNKVDNGIMIYHFVGGSMERVFANTPVTHGEQLFVNYVFNPDMQGGTYALVAESALFGEVKSAPHAITLITQDINVSMPNVTMAQGSTRALTANDLMGVADSQIGLSNLALSSSDTDVVKVYYDEPSDTWILSTEGTSKIGEATITVKAPNGKTASNTVVVYTEITGDNTQFELNGVAYSVATEPSEIDITSGSTLVANLLINGVRYNKTPQGMTLVATDYDNKVVNLSSDRLSVFTLNTTASTTITFTLTNFYQPDEALVYRFVINVTVPVSKLNINSPIADIYSINSINMDDYKDKTVHNVIVSASPSTAVLLPENFTFRVRYNGAFYEPIDVYNNAEGKKYTFELISGGNFEVYVQTYNDDPTMYTVTTRLFVEYTDSYQFDMYVGYSQNYMGINGTYNVTVSKSVTIITKNAAHIRNIYNNLGNKNIDFNTNQLVGDEGNWTQGHEQVFNFTINPSASNVFVSTVLVTGGNVTLNQSQSTDSVLVYENSYLQITVDNTTGRVRVKLLAIPTDPTLMQTTFALAAKDSIRTNGTYGVTSEFIVKINDGKSAKTAFTINTAEQLQDMQNDLDSFYVLSADVYMDGKFNARNPFTPVGTTANPFTGHLSGAYEFKGNYAYYGIYNMWVGNTFDSTNPEAMPTNTYGLFGVNSGTIKDVSIVGLTVHVEYGTLDAGNVYVGAIAGINLGTIENCSVISYSGLDASDTTLTALNGGNITTGVQLRDFSNTVHTSYVGGIAGVNASAITNTTVATTISVADTVAGSVVAGGMAGANTSFNDSGALYNGTIVNEYTNSSFANRAYDVLAIINGGNNTDSIYKLTNNRSVVGGVVGINNFYSGLRTDTTTIDGTYVRALIGAMNNVGGVAGINSGAIYNVTVQPVLVAGDYVGGAAGTNYAGDHSDIFALDNTLNYTRINGDFQGSIKNTKVQFIEQNYTLSYLNTGIYAHNYVGGLVGAEYGIVRGYASAQTYDTLSMNSVYSYITREASGTYATNSTDSAFYGDMVATGVHVGGLVGQGIHTDIVGGLVNIQTVTGGTYGGALGTAIGALHLADIQVAGAVSGTTQVGGLVGNATAINDNLASSMGIDIGKLLPTSAQLVNHAQLGSNINYHITTSYTVLKVADNAGNYVNNFAYTGNTISGTTQGVLRHLSTEGDVTYINYFSNSGVVKEAYTIPTIDDGNGNLVSNDVGTIKGGVQTTRNLLAVANSWYVGFNTMISGASTTFTYDYVTSTTDRSAWNITYDNLRNYDITVVGRYSDVDFGLTGSDPSNAQTVLTAGAVIRGANTNITSVKAVNARKYSIYSVTDATYSDQYFYYNSQVFGGLPVSMIGVIDGKLCLIFEIAPTDISIRIKSYVGNVLNSSEAIIALAYKGTDDAQYALNDVIDLSVIPAFADSTKLVITSSNTNVLKVVGSDLVPVSAGVATLKVTSVYNASVTASVTVMVYNDVTEYALTDANGNALTGAVTVVKNYTTTLNSKFTSTPANAVTGLLLSTDVDTTFTINGTALTAGNAVHFDTSVVSLYGTAEGNATLAYTPYVKYTLGGVTYIKYLYNYEGTVNVNVELGNYGFNTSGNITLSPVGNVEFDIAVNTDNSELVLAEAVKDVDTNKFEAPTYNKMTYTVSYNGTIVTGEQLIDNDHITFDGILDLLMTGSNYADGTKTFTFSARVNHNVYTSITYARTYTISVKMLRYDGEKVEKEFDIIIRPQSLTNIILTHYSQVLNVSDEQLADEDLQEGQIQVYKYSSNTLVPGYPGLLHIDLHPVYGQYDYLTVTSPAGDALQFEQMVEVANKGEYSTFASTNTASAVNGGIRISGKYSALDGSAYIYNGRIYVRTNAATSIQNTTIPVTVSCYLDDGTCVYTEDIDIVIVEPPYVSLGVGEDYAFKNAPIATGTDIIFRAVSSGVTDAPVINVGGDTQNIRYLGDGLYQYTHNVSSLYDLINAIGSDITINATVTKTINNRVYSATDSITLRVAKYVVTDIQVERVNNGYFEGKYNQIYPLRTTVYAKYNDLLYRFVNLQGEEISSITITNPLDDNQKINDVTPIKNDLVELANQIDALGLSGATPQTQTWFVRTGTDEMQALEVKEYSTFIVREVKENEITTTLSIQNTVVSAMDTLYAVVSIAYGKDADGENEYGPDGLKLLTSTSANPNPIDYTYQFTRPFTFNFTRINDGENPEPIYNVDQFKNMKRGVHYILQSDIVLENWLPMEANFASLDGNSYVITIKSFGDLNPLYPAGTSTPYIGLFSTVSGDYDNVVENKSTVIKNLTVELLQDISINITDYTNVYFGVIAGYNEGVITNCQVINNANDLIAERNGMLTLLTGHTNEEYPKVDVSGRIKDITGLDTLPETPSVILFQGADASVVSHGNYISGFVGQNVGYITNSAVRNITINGSDYVSGFVGSNSGTISSSYFKGGNVINNDSLTKSNSGTAGFVSVNASNSTIQYSYVMGRVKETDITNISPDDKKDYLGYAYRNEARLGTLRALNSMVLTNNYAGGFVYDNQGNIDNSYSNILVSGTGSAGFAYRNNGADSLISYCYSLSSGTGSGFTPFSFKTTAGTSTSVRDCYYLQVDRQDTDNETYYEQLSNDARADGTAINANAFGDYNSFQAYAFNTDYSTNSIQEVTKAVWFIPTNTESGKMSNELTLDYLKDDYYYASRPELVSANLRVTPLKMYHATDVGEDGKEGFTYNDATKRKSINTDTKVVNITHGESVLNPYLVDTSAKFNIYCTPNSGKGENSVNDTSDAHIRFIKDITFDNDTQTAATYSTIFKGDLDGNGMQINNLRILADSIDSGNASDRVAGKKFGLFAEISGGSVRNLTINIAEINGVNVQCVGVLAGVISDRTEGTDGHTTTYNSVVANINVEGNVLVQGLNAVGGVAGVVLGDSFVINVTSNVSVKSNYRGNVNMFSATNSVGTRVTPYNLFDENSNDGQDGYNFTNISYAGGIAGILHVNANPDDIGADVRNFGRARRTYIASNIEVRGQVVGGLFGYVGKDTILSDSYVLVGDSTKLNATRVVGGLVGHNLGTIQRSYVAHVAAVQDAIDNYIANTSNLARIDNATTDIRLVDTNYNVFVGNPHYMGGIAGINLGGAVVNSYNRVPVANINAEYAGGILGVSVGGKLNSVYTTASVYAFRGIGGIIGVQTAIKTATKIENGETETYIPEPVQLQPILGVNYENAERDIVPIDIANGIDANTNVRNVVGANIWLSSHTNTERSIVGKNPDANPAMIGTIVGVTTHVMNFNGLTSIPDSIGGIITSTLTERAVNESVYAKTQWTYASRNSTPKRVIAEFGAINNNLETMQNVLNAYADTEDSAIRGASKVIIDNRTPEGKVYMLYGTHKLEGTALNYHYSRMQMISSSRTLQEIFNRISNVGSANVTYTALGASNEETDGGVASKIYYNFSTAEWDGTRVDDSNNKISSEFVFPALSTKAVPSIINVYNETDLRTMHTYLYSSFVLQNDIELTAPWEPVGTKNLPFRGKVYSKRKAIGTGYEQYTIRNFTIDSSQDAVGLIAYGESVELHHFDVAVNSVTSRAENANVSVLMANATSVNDKNVTTIDNVNIVQNVSSRYFTLQGSNTVESIGALVASGENINITNSQVLDGVVLAEKAGAEGIYAGLAFGKLTGNNAWIDNIGTRGELSINTNTTYQALGVGGVGGYIEVQPQIKVEPESGDKTVVTDMHLRSECIITVNPVNPESQLTRVGIGGLLGYIEAEPLNIVNDSNVNIEYKVNLTDYVTSGYHLRSKITLSDQVIAESSSSMANMLNAGSMLGHAKNVNITDFTDSMYNIIEYSKNVFGIEIANIGGVVGNLANSTISNVNIDDTNIYPSTNYHYISDDAIYTNVRFGLITGRAENSAISNVTVQNGNIRAYKINIITAGGIAGIAVGSKIEYCYVLNSAISIDSNESSVLGGIVGYVGDTCPIQHVVTSGTLTIYGKSNSAYAGGIVGQNYGGKLTLNNAVNNADIYVSLTKASRQNIGGLLGFNMSYIGANTATISSSYATGNIYVLERFNTMGVGGLVGGATAQTTINDCYTLTNIIVDSNSVKGYNSTLNTSRIDHIVGYCSNMNIVTATNTFAVAEFNPQLQAKVGTIITAYDFLTSTTNFGSDFKAKTNYSYPLLAWVDDASTYNSAVLQSVQKLGTKQNPAQLTTINQSVLNANKSIVIVSDANMETGDLSNNVVYLFNSLNLHVPSETGFIFNEISADSLLVGNNKAVHITEGQQRFVRSNKGKIVRLRIWGKTNGPAVGYDGDYYKVIASNDGIIFGCTLSSTTREYLVDAMGVIDTCELNTVGTAIKGTNKSFLLINSKIIGSAGFIGGTDSNSNITDCYHVANNAVTYYGNKASRTEFSTIADATAINNYGNAGLSWGKFMLVKGNANNVDNILRLRWEFKDDCFDEDISSRYIWRGDGASGGYLHAGSSYLVSTAEGLAYVLQNMEGSYQINLLNDIDLGGKLWMPINNKYGGIINGNGHTIRNMSAYVVGNNAEAGFIASVSGHIKIQNVKFYNASSFAHSTSSTAKAAVLIANVSDGADLTIQSVAVDRCSVFVLGGNYAGMIAYCNKTQSISLIDTYVLLVGNTIYNNNAFIGYAGNGNRSVEVKNSYSVFLKGYSGSEIPVKAPSYITIHDGLLPRQEVVPFVLVNSSSSFTLTNVYSGNIHTKRTNNPNENTLETSDLNALQSEDLSGFDWVTTWTRITNGSDSLWQLPQLTGQMKSWQEYALAREATILPGIESSVAGPIGLRTQSVTVDTAEEFAYVMGQLSLESSQRTLYTQHKNVEIKLTANIDLGARHWEPVTIANDITSVVLSSDGTSLATTKVISNLSISGANAGLFGVNSTKINVNSIFFNNAKVYGTSYAGVLFAQLNNSGSINANTEHRLTNIRFFNCNVICSNNAGLLGGQICNATIQSVVASGGSVRVTNSNVPISNGLPIIVTNTHLGGLVGLSKYNTYDSCRCENNTQLTSNNVAYVGGIIGQSQDDREISGLRCDAITCTIQNVVFAGGAIGELELTNGAQYSSKVSAVTVTRLNMTVESDIDYQYTMVGGAIGYTNNTSSHELVIENIHLGTAELVNVNNGGGANTSIARVSGGGTFSVTVNNDGYVGGVVGAVASKVKLYELYADVTIALPSVGYVGGVVGYVAGSGNTFSNFYYYHARNIDGTSYNDLERNNPYITTSGSAASTLIGYIQSLSNTYGLGYTDNRGREPYDSNGTLTINFINSGTNENNLFDQSSSWIRGEIHAKDWQDHWSITHRFYIPLWAVENSGTTHTMVDMVNALPEQDGEDDYQVATYADMDNINNYIRYRYNNVQSIDIDIFNDITIDSDVTEDSDIAFRPLGSRYYPYFGEFNGGNNTITMSNVSKFNLDADCFGIIGYSKEGSTIQNVNIKLVGNLNLHENNVASTVDYVGLLVGYAYRTTISNINVYADADAGISARTYVGGVIGMAHGSTVTKISNGYMPDDSYAYGVSVVGQGALGGLIGWMYGGSKITNSQAYKIELANNSVFGSADTWHVGGAVGRSEDSTIGDSAVTGSTADIFVYSVTFKAIGPDFTRLGGIVGGTYATNIYSCRVSSLIIENTIVSYAGGGIVGEFNDEGYVVTNCNVNINSMIKGGTCIGGIIGVYNFEADDDSYTTSTTITNNTFIAHSLNSGVMGTQYVGGIVGKIIPTEFSTSTLSNITAASKLRGNTVDAYIEADVTLASDSEINTFTIKDFDAQVNSLNKDASDWKDKVQFNNLELFTTYEDYNTYNSYYVGNHQACVKQSTMESNSNRYVPLGRSSKSTLQSIMTSKYINFVIGNTDNTTATIKTNNFANAEIVMSDNHTLIRLTITENSNNYEFKENNGVLGIGKSRTLIINNLRISAIRSSKVMLQGNGNYYSSTRYGDTKEVSKLLAGREFKASGTDWNDVKTKANEWFNSTTTWTINWNARLDEEKIIEG